MVSVDRVREYIDPDLSQQTVITSMPTTSKASSSKGLPTFKVHEQSDEQNLPSKDVSLEEPTAVKEEAVEEEQGSISFWQKIIHWFTIVCLFIESCVISATAKLNHVSRDYRYVSRRLAVEKRALKLLFEMEEAEGVNYDSDWKKSTLEKISKASVPQVKRVDSVDSFKAKHKGSDDKLLQKKTSPAGSSPEWSDEAECGFTFLDSNAFIRFFRSLFYTVVSQSEIVCYTMVIFNQIVNASLLSLPLPIMVFVWGCLSVPRPSKTFWISLITYTEAVVVAKYVFHFRVWPWLSYSTWQPVVIGVGSGGGDDDITATHVDLVLLLFLFFHRFMLKVYKYIVINHVVSCIFIESWTLGFGFID